MTSFKDKLGWSLKDRGMGPDKFRTLSCSFCSQQARQDLSASLKTARLGSTSVVLEERAQTDEPNAIKNRDLWEQVMQTLVWYFRAGIYLCKVPFSLVVPENSQFTAEVLCAHCLEASPLIAMKEMEITLKYFMLKDWGMSKSGQLIFKPPA